MAKVVSLLIFSLLALWKSYWNLTASFCGMSENSELGVTIVSFVVSAVMVLSFLGAVAFQKKNAPYLFICFLVSGILVLTSVFRNNEVKEQNWSFDGVVNEKYRSKNHNMKSLKIDEQIYEGVHSDIWSNVEKGDRVKKEVCSNRLVVNGIEVVFQSKRSLGEERHERNPG